MIHTRSIRLSCVGSLLIARLTHILQNQAYILDKSPRLRSLHANIRTCRGLGSSNLERSNRGRSFGKKIEYVNDPAPDSCSGRPLSASTMTIQQNALSVTQSPGIYSKGPGDLDVCSGQNSLPTKPSR